MFQAKTSFLLIYNKEKILFRDVKYLKFLCVLFNENFNRNIFSLFSLDITPKVFVDPVASSNFVTFPYFLVLSLKA